ncbi:MAG: DUF4304 domain-containing protein [Xanthomonadales bacterium]|nr:DUF4304 domain-containing protein [Xanthomonadales bacterium]
MDTPLKARDIIRSIVGGDLAAALKSAGFRKSGLTFTRRTGSTGQLIQIQLSSWSHGSSGTFFVNVAVMFDDMCAKDRTPPVQPKYDDCQFMARLERIVPEAPAHWGVDAQTSSDEVSRLLTNYLVKSVIEPLDQVASLADFERTGWVKAIPWSFPAPTSALPL